MAKNKEDNAKLAKLRLWQERKERMSSAYSAEYTQMDRREKAYLGDRSAEPVTQNLHRTRPQEVRMVRNVTAELIETQVDINIPAPKITPQCSEDEDLAMLAEAWLLSELDRLPSETLNDIDERTTRIQGGDYLVVDWDQNVRTHTTVGDVALRTLHPKQFLPQEGIWFDLEDQDYYIIRRPMTKTDVCRRYGCDMEALEKETESDPDIKGADAESTRSMEDMVTVYEGTARSEKGIDRFVWVNDIVLEDLEDFQARRTRVCEDCGLRESEAQRIRDAAATRQVGGVSAGLPNGSSPGNSRDYLDPENISLLGMINESAVEAMEATNPFPEGRCPECGGRFVEGPEEYEELWEPIERSLRERIELPEDGQPLRIPRYKPDLYPVVLRRNIPIYGKLLGISDVDRIADQQNALNVMDNLIADKLSAAGSFLLLPQGIQVDDSNGNYKVIRLRSAQDKQLIDVVSTEVPVSQDMAWEATIYEHAKQQLGITDSFQGRKDTTATSGVAKEFSASQAASRMESRRICKNVAWAKLYEIMFKYWLAYSDEPRQVIIRDQQNHPTYQEINRYDFLKQDAAGEWYWNTDFRFSTDEAQPLANNRTQMWQETIMAYTQGLFGNPTDPDTQILVWTKLEELHYPMAGQTKDFLIQKNQRMMKQQPPTPTPTETPPQLPEGAPMEGTSPEMAPEEIPGETVRLDTAASAANREVM